MRGYLSLACAAFLALAIVTIPKPASALPAASSIAQGQASASLVHEAQYYRRRYYRPYRYRRYGYRPYYNRRPYYRPYYRGWGYPYYRRPGVRLWFGW
jgi:hypothetical protein